MSRAAPLIRLIREYEPDHQRMLEACRLVLHRRLAEEAAASRPQATQKRSEAKRHGRDTAGGPVAQPDLPTANEVLDQGPGEPRR